MSTNVKYLGLAAASRSAICGSELVITAIRKNPQKVYLVLLAKDASERTKKQITDKCAYYKVKLLEIDLDMNALSSALGKSSLVAACAITNKGLAEKIEENS